MKTVITKRMRVKGWQEKLQKNWNTFEQFAAASDIYGIAKRLGYKSNETAWKANPMVEGSVYPEDLRKVPKKEYMKI